MLPLINFLELMDCWRRSSHGTHSVSICGSLFRTLFLLSCAQSLEAKFGGLRLLTLAVPSFKMGS